ncbi:glycosyltransferase [Mycolicibacterium sp. 050232]|uniref:glycosyltransferase family 2 protein n=1 Tax=Mycolicibacterium sp. 050232 TaxID=3113982 RepID=UPI002E28C80E|nr:glycosyltransferase [Mycolicibacterium sp. 050232]MED5814339.1 glycosyltransferase [Mycolicibacterium sp. 050232]
MRNSGIDPDHPTIGIAVTTVGRWDALRGLLDDLSRQSRPPHAVAIAHHNAEAAGELDALVRSFSGKLTITTVVSPRGISNGRNAAAAMLGDDIDWLYFPNDTSRLDDDFLARIAQHTTPDQTVCAAQLVDLEGVRNALPPTGTPLTRRNVWGAIEPATLFRRRDFVQVGGFDPALGSGAQTPWQAGEGTDLLIRLSELDDFSIDWIHDIAVHAQTEFAHLTPSERRRKIRFYGRGTGYLYRRWDYPAWDKFRHVFGALLSPVLKRDKFRPRDGFALALGRAEGVLGRVLSDNTDNRAIVR